MTQPTTENKFDFIPRTSFLPWEWRSLGGVFGFQTDTKQALSGRCTFVIKQGFDPLEQASTGRVLETQGDAGVSIRHKSLAFSLTLGNVSYKTGLDDPLDGHSVAEPSIPSLKATIAKELGPDKFVAVSYDLKQRKPEVSLCWTGDTFAERATLMVHADPLYRTYKLGAAISFPGPEWRVDVLDSDTDLVETPQDDGGRHIVWVQHEVKDRNWLRKTRMGMRLNLGRIANYAADYVDYNIEERLPGILWHIPFSRVLYNLLVPPEDENQVRHNIKNWHLDVAHDFSKRKPAIAISKSFKHATISAGYDFDSREATVEYGQGPVRLAARLGRMEGQGWKQPALQLYVEPLSLL